MSIETKYLIHGWTSLQGQEEKKKEKEKEEEQLSKPLPPTSLEHEVGDQKPPQQ